jgi:hypothetical protein
MGQAMNTLFHSTDTIRPRPAFYGFSVDAEAFTFFDHPFPVLSLPASALSSDITDPSFEECQAKPVILISRFLRSTWDVRKQRVQIFPSQMLPRVVSVGDDSLADSSISVPILAPCKAEEIPFQADKDAHADFSFDDNTDDSSSEDGPSLSLSNVSGELDVSDSSFKLMTPPSSLFDLASLTAGGRGLALPVKDDTSADDPEVLLPTSLCMVEKAAAESFVLVIPEDSTVDVGPRAKVQVMEKDAGKSILKDRTNIGVEEYQGKGELKAVSVRRHQTPSPKRRQPSRHPWR